uniref:Uncharacterized protein n=1 Tax=Anopheles atroparvus TaxID=41427 RepID=A0A182J6I3_ANOAO
MLQQDTEEDDISVQLALTSFSGTSEPQPVQKRESCGNRKANHPAGLVSPFGHLFRLPFRRLRRERSRSVRLRAVKDPFPDAKRAIRGRNSSDFNVPLVPPLALLNPSARVQVDCGGLRLYSGGRFTTLANTETKSKSSPANPSPDVPTHVEKVLANETAQIKCDVSSNLTNDRILLVVWYKDNVPIYSFDTRGPHVNSPSHWKDVAILEDRANFKTTREQSRAVLVISPVQHEQRSVDKHSLFWCGPTPTPCVTSLRRVIRHLET